MPIVFPNSTIQEIGGVVSVPGSRVIQTIETRSTATLSVANWATQNELFTAAITPTSTSSRILIYIHGSFRMDVAAGNWSLGYMWVHNTTRNVGLIASGWNGTTRLTISSYERKYLDSPNSTATQTYSFRVGNYPSGTCHWNNTGQNAHDGFAYMTLMEISG
jgi:hypothetical protein